MTGLVIMDTVCMVAPYFAAILLCMETIVKSLDSFWGMWGILLLTIIMSCLLILIVMKYVSERKQVPFNVLLHKVLPPFIMAIRTGSIDNGFGKMTDSCTRDLGIEKSFAAVSLPYGLILYMPVSAIGTLMFTIYIAVKDGLVLSIGWIVVAVVLSVALCVATPPVPGASLLSYIVIFQELGIPQEALIDAMIFDILFGIFSGAANQMLLQLDLILQADKIGLLKKDVLRKEEAN
jgi:Na+/H+-dicarboxylate symporter